MLVFTPVLCAVVDTTRFEEEADMAGWKTQDIQQLNGKAERIKLPAKLQVLTESWTGNWTGGKKKWSRHSGKVTRRYPSPFSRCVRDTRILAYGR